jgi:hypothetical protein
VKHNTSTSPRTCWYSMSTRFFEHSSQVSASHSRQWWGLRNKLNWNQHSEHRSWLSGNTGAGYPTVDPSIQYHIRYNAKKSSIQTTVWLARLVHISREKRLRHRRCKTDGSRKTHVPALSGVGVAPAPPPTLAVLLALPLRVLSADCTRWALPEELDSTEAPVLWPRLKWFVLHAGRKEATSPQAASKTAHRQFIGDTLQTANKLVACTFVREEFTDTHTSGTHCAH